MAEINCAVDQQTLYLMAGTRLQVRHIAHTWPTCADQQIARKNAQNTSLQIDRVQYVYKAYAGVHRSCLSNLMAVGRD